MKISETIMTENLLKLMSETIPSNLGSSREYQTGCQKKKTNWEYNFQITEHQIREKFLKEARRNKDFTRKNRD